MMKNSTLVTDPAPAGLEAVQDYQVEVNGTVLYLYNAKVNSIRIPDKDLYPEQTPFGYFGMDGPVEIKITAPKPVDFVDIRPKSFAIQPTITSNTVSFTLHEPKKLTIEFDGNLHRALHLFANPVEVDAPEPEDPNVRYFGPGIHHPGVIQLQNNQTVYLAGGAYVYGIVRGEGIANACVRGPGILCAGKAPWPQGGFQVKNCRSLTMRDFILLDSAGWSVKIDGCEDVLIENFKEICYRRNCDGIDLCSTRNAVVHDCFIRNWDDALCVKGLGNGDSKNTTISKCILWSDAAQSIEIGYETQMEKLEDVLIKDIDILHHLMPGYLCITVHNGDRAAISNIRFEDIRIEDSVDPLFDIWVGKAHWNQDERRGRVKGLYYKNISLIGGTNPDDVNRYQAVGSDESELSYLAALTSRIAGYDAEHNVEDVTFENINVLGRTILSPADGNFAINEFVKNVRFIEPADGSPVIQYTLEPAVLTCPPAEATFDASQSTGQGGARIVSYAWDFGDGQTATTAIASHSFARPGNYPVSLSICDERGRSSRVLRILTVLPAYPAVPAGQVVPGLKYAYTEGDFNFGSDLTKFLPIASGETTGITAPRHIRHDYHAVRYEGLLKVEAEGVYRFFAGMDFSTGYDMLAGGSIWLHDRLVSANNNGWGQIALQPGFHPIRIELFKKSGARPVTFKIMGPGMPAQPIPAELLYHSGE